MTGQRFFNPPACTEPVQSFGSGGRVRNATCSSSMSYQRTETDGAGRPYDVFSCPNGHVEHWYHEPIPEYQDNGKRVQ